MTMAASSSSSSFSFSSSSPKKKKTNKLSPTKQTTFKKPNSSSSKATSLTKRRETVFRKAIELSILCGIEVCVICYGPDGELKTWPEDIEKVKDIARRYSELSDAKRSRGRVDLHEVLEKINKEDSKNKNKKKKKILKIMKKKVMLGSSSSSNNEYPEWDPRFETYSKEQLMELEQSLVCKQTRFKQRMRDYLEAQKQNMSMADQEHMMNHHHHLQQQQQHHSNQVSMFLLNHGNGTYSQIPAFNQSQSLAPFPTPLTIYPNPNANKYSGLLGIQETGINGFQNMLTNNNNIIVNDFPKQISNGEGYSGMQGTETNQFMMNTNMYNCNNNNFNVEDYNSGLLGVQDFGINELQNMNMYGGGYNDNINTNDLLHQLDQFPTQTAAPGFHQFGSFRTQY